MDDFAAWGLPLDVLVLDMNWHTKNDWTGYSFDTRLYPFPDELFKSLEDDGLLVSLNLHDVRVHEPQSLCGFHFNHGSVGFLNDTLNCTSIF